MTTTIHARIGRMLPERVKNFVADMAAPRVVERERELLDKVERALGAMVSRIEAEVRAKDEHLCLLDSPDVRLAIGDLHARTSLFSRYLERDALGVDGLLAFIHTAADMGVGAVKAAPDFDEAADAVGRAVDHVQDYMVSHDLLDVDVLDKSHVVDPQDVRKVHARVSVREIAAWAPARETLEKIAPSAGPTSVA